MSKTKKTKIIEIKFTTSRAKETDGYTIASLYIDGVKVNYNCGGGYDMKGTCLADYIQKNYQDRLLKISHRSNSRYTINVNAKNKYRSLKALKVQPVTKGGRVYKNFYGMTSYKYMGEKRPFKVRLNGACGWSSIDNICGYIGLNLQYLEENSNSIKYSITDKKKG